MARSDDECRVNVARATLSRINLPGIYTLSSTRINNRRDDCEISAGDGNCWKLDDSSPFSLFLA